LYATTTEIVHYIQKTFHVKYTLSGITDWLKRHGFSYKQPVGTPSKADRHKPQEFLEIYQPLKTQSDIKDEPILFIDGVHPSMQTKITHGWIKKGYAKPIATTASRTRVNLMGAIHLNTMQIVTQIYHKTIHGESIMDFFDHIKSSYMDKPVIHLILDQAGYQTSRQVRAYAYALGIHLHYLPAYSPNLNAIESVWKLMNEKIRNNTFFKSAKDFKHKIKLFLNEDLNNILPNLRSRINDNFHIEKAAN